jgi:hypothetical protein
MHQLISNFQSGPPFALPSAGLKHRSCHQQNGDFNFALAITKLDGTLIAPEPTQARELFASE